MKYLGTYENIEELSAYRLYYINIIDPFLLGIKKGRSLSMSAVY